MLTFIDGEPLKARLLLRGFTVFRLFRIGCTPCTSLNEWVLGVTYELMKAQEMQTSRSETEVSGEAKQQNQDREVDVESRGDERN